MLKIGEIPYIGKLIQKFLTNSIHSDYAVKVQVEKSDLLLGNSHQETICDRRILTSAPLTADGWYTGDVISVVKYKSISIHVYGDSDMYVAVEQSEDGSNWFKCYSSNYTSSSTFQPPIIYPTMQFVRVLAHNTSVSDQTTLKISIALQP